MADCRYDDRVPLSIKARRQQGLSEIQRLSQEFSSWQEEVQLPQYTTQVEAIAAEVTACAERLKGALDSLGPLPTGAAYARCTRIEKQIAWLWRAWEYFRAKFDQRADARFGETLRAADEVVWSCYRPFFVAPMDQRVPNPAPLPYIEMEYSPVAVRSDQGAVIGGRPNQQELIAAAFQKLPTPILKLPISVVQNPWAIALAGHEVGHFVQRMISGNPLVFVNDFRVAIETAADDPDWGSWAPEIFADWYSVLTMGQWAMHPIAQFGAGTAEENGKPGDVYPPLLIRLQLMAAMADFYGFPGTKALDAIGLERPQAGELAEYDKHAALVDKVALAIVGLEECKAVAGRVSARADNYAEGGTAGQWAKFIAKGGGHPATNRADSARLVAAGSVQAWDQHVFTPAEPPQEDMLDTLRDRARQAMKDAAMPGTRASAAVVTRAAGTAGDALFAALEEIANG